MGGSVEWVLAACRLMAHQDERATSRIAIDGVVRRFLGDEVSLDEAAREIARLLPSDEVWGLLWSQDTSPKDVARLRKLTHHILKLLGEAAG